MKLRLKREGPLPNSIAYGNSQQVQCDLNRASRSLPINPWARTPLRNGYTRLQQRRAYHSGKNEASIDSANFVSHSESRAAPTVFKASTSTLSQSAAQQENSGGEYGVLGGGITGLSAAHYLTKYLPHAKVTIYESTDRLGGWLRSDPVEVEGGEVYFEQGPRSLRPNVGGSGLAVMELIQDLDLRDQLIITPKTSVSAANRYLYYPDHLVKMPGPGGGLIENFMTLIREPCLRWAPLASIREYRNPPRLPSVKDETVYEFITRRFGTKDAADMTLSAVLHGIYAGDITQLSAKSLFPQFWYLEEKYGSIIKGLYAAGTGRFWMHEDDVKMVKELKPKIEASLYNSLALGASVFSFKKGIGAIAVGLENSLLANPKVTFRKGFYVQSMSYKGESDKIEITTTEENTPTASFDKVISTLSGPNLSSIVSGKGNTHLATLAGIHSVTVMVVNLYFPSTTVLPVHGFGYLIPRAIPYEQNPECALGVVFDSDAVTGQDTVEGTKVTVMIGGHWWDGVDSYPDSVEGLQMARNILARHLGITDEPTAHKVGLQKNCIPQYTEGHESRLQVAHSEIKERFHGKLAVAGNSFKGVGLGDCVRNARDLVRGLAYGNEELTGLEDIGKPTEWLPVPYALNLKHTPERAR